MNTLKNRKFRGGIRAVIIACLLLGGAVFGGRADNELLEYIKAGRLGEAEEMSAGLTVDGQKQVSEILGELKAIRRENIATAAAERGRVMQRLEAAGSEEKVIEIINDLCAIDANVRVSGRVERAVREALVAAEGLERDGRWEEAGRYYSATGRLEGYRRYVEKAKLMSRLSAIDARLEFAESGGAGETYEQLKRAATKALSLIDYKYYKIAEHRRMGSEGLTQCALLGKVIEKKGLRSVRSAAQWRAGIERLRGNSSIHTSEDIAGLLEEVVKLNRRTLGLDDAYICMEYFTGCLEPLDPFTEIVWPVRLERLNRSLSNEITGIGVHLKARGSYIEITGVIPGTPAANTELGYGDVIIAVDGRSLEEVTFEQALDMISGPAGRTVILTVRCAEDGLRRNVTIRREKFRVDSVKGWRRKPGTAGSWDFMLDNDRRIGYINIASFDEDTGDDFAVALDELVRDSAKALVIDLRFNMGGDLLSAVRIADLFIDRGIIIKRQSRWGLPTIEYARDDDSRCAMPLAVLVNSGSASSSEILAAVLTDSAHEKAFTLGSRTWGKGCIQVITNLAPSRSLFKYTIETYLTSSGAVVENRFEKDMTQSCGLVPDYILEITPGRIRQLQRLSSRLRSRPSSDRRGDFEELTGVDLQLESARLILAAELVVAPVKNTASNFVAAAK